MRAFIRHPFAIAGLIICIFAVDVVTGPYIQFPITFVIPVGIVAWWYGRNFGIGLAIGLALARFVVVSVFEPELVDGQIGIAVLNAIIRGVVLSVLAWLIARVATQHRQLSHRVKVLEGLLPICSFCKKIRNTEGRWEQIEAYISNRSEAKFSHGFCEAYGREHYPEVFGPACQPPAK